MKIALIQPQFAPNMYDLVSMLRADRVVLLDVDLWSRKGRTHRAMIKESEWINIPIKTEDKKKAIKEVRIDHTNDWYTPFWNGIYHNNHHRTYFDYFEDELKALFEEVRTSKYLIDFNLAVFQRLLQFLEVDMDVELASESSFNLEEYSTIYIENECRNYFRHVPYPDKIDQRVKLLAYYFELSIFFLLFNEGPESYSVLESLSY